MHFIEKKTKRCFIILFLGCMLFVGCGDETRGNSIQQDSAEEDLVTTWEEISESTEAMNLIQVMDDSIYTAYWNYDYEAMRKMDCRVDCEKSDGSVETIAEFDEVQLVHFLVGKDGAVYYLYTGADESDKYYLRKDTADGVTEFDKFIGEANGGETAVQLGEVNCGVVTAMGELCLMSCTGKVFLVDADGQMVTVLETGRERLADKEAEGVVYCEDKPYLYRLEEGQATLWSVNMEKGELGNAIYLSTDSGKIDRVFSGFDNGIYLMDSDGIWNYRFEENVHSQILLWGNENVDVNPVFVESISVMADGGICILYEDLVQKILARILVEKKDTTEISGKQNITIGVSKTSDYLEAVVQKFNMQSNEYRVQIVIKGDESQYQKDLLMGNGMDLYELNDMPIKKMASLGVLENLDAYLTESEMIQGEQLLSCVREAGTVDGKLVGIAPEFYLLALVTDKGTTDNGGWTVEEFLTLSEKYSTSRLTSYDDKPINIILNVLSYEVNNRIDWEEKTCDFDSESFRQILKSLYENSKRECMQETALTEAEKLYKKEQLVLKSTIYSPWAYVEFREAFGEFGELVGYPTTEGEPAYQLYAEYMLGINSASECKEGAWSFLEFWLGEEMQRNTYHFPARKDVFEEMLAQDASPRDTEKGMVEELCTRFNFYTGEKFAGFLRLNDEDRNAVRYMVEHAGYGNAMEQEMIRVVLFEELQAYFAGDKTIEVVTDIIQNRITLYLSELE